jgi:hypothetical protein
MLLASAFEEKALRAKSVEVYAPPLDVTRALGQPTPTFREWPTLERLTHGARTLVKRLASPDVEPSESTDPAVLQRQEPVRSPHQGQPQET